MAEVPVRPSDAPTAAWSPEPVAADLAPRLPWGPWASIGWTVLAMLLIVVTQFGVAIVYAIARKVADPRADLAGMGTDGTFLALATLTTLPVVLALVGVLVLVRGWKLRDYLALRSARVGAAALATLGLICWLALSDGLTIVLDRPIVPPFMTEALFTTPLWLLALAVVFAAPILEEVVFRGFLYRGLAESRLGPGMAIGLTAVAWAIPHVQYDLYGVATVYMTGLYLGLVRHYSGSLILTIFLHALANTIATAEAVVLPG